MLLALTFWCLPQWLLAQLTVSAPQSRIVYQRNQANQATIPVAGIAPPQTDRVEARLIPLQGGQQTDWTGISILSDNKAFGGNIIAQAGWYRLDLRAWAGGNLVGETTVGRVGIGEVFVVAGQSNAFGAESSHGASDDRVSCLDFHDETINEQLFPTSFSHADAGTNLGPSNPLHIWAMLGDRLVRKLNVPVLILGAAQPGTSSAQWRKSAEGAGEYAPTYSPYRRLGATLMHYIARTGMRAILWHQGEGDVAQGGQQYFDNVQFIINKSRQQSNFGSLAWVVARATYVQGQTDENIIAAQNRLIGEVPNVFAGPSTDQLTGEDNRADNTHVSGNGLFRFTDLWEQSLTDDFFARSIPYSVSTSPLITTGTTMPYIRITGEQIRVPYVQNMPISGVNQFSVQLLRADGGVVGTLATGNQNPMVVTLPGSLDAGQYRLRVVSTRPALTGTMGEVFQVNQGTPPPPAASDASVQPTLVSGTPDAVIRKVGYKYDASSHGFQLLADADGTVDMRLERLDGGFGETNWRAATLDGEYSGYNNVRFYAPVQVGVGGVEPGRYRLSVRRQGNAGAGLIMEVSLLDGQQRVYAITDNYQPITNDGDPAVVLPVQPKLPVQPQAPQIQQTPTAQVTGGIRDIGYKYDAISHGFQLLANADGALDMRLERLDGNFAETNWSSASSTADYAGYTHARFYAPVQVGVGGVEPGRYRLWVRQQGDSGEGYSVEVTLVDGQNEQRSVGGQTAQSVAIASSTAPTTVSQPQETPPVATAGAIRAIGYKYDATSHGFQLLANADGALDMRLERLDSYFAENDWQAAVSSSDYAGYTQQRFYAPDPIGEGGVQAGIYRLWVRRPGNSATEQSIDVTLQDGIYIVAGTNGRQAAAKAEPTAEVVWRAWPNPFVQELTVAIPDFVIPATLRVMLTTSTGQTQLIPAETMRADGQQLHISIGPVASGLYLLQVYDGQRPLQTLKVVKQ